MKQNKAFKIVAVTACPTGIAHTYMAADELARAADELGFNIRIETQGAMGLENELKMQEIMQADLALIASDIEIENGQRFEMAKHCLRTPIEPVLVDAKGFLQLLHAKCDIK